MKVFKRYLPLLCAALLIIGSSMTVFASTVVHLPSGITEKANELWNGTDYDYIIFKTEEGYKFCAISLENCFYYSNGGIYINADKYITATSTDGAVWSGLSGWSSSGGCHMVTSLNVDYTVITSSCDIVKFSNSGNYYRSTEYIKENSTGIFFQRPPVPVAELAVPLTAKIQNQVGKILPVAVGCLALLIGSIVLLPRLRIFL